MAATIMIQNNAFSPLDLTVAAGATVTVTNMDAVQHSVTSETAKDSFQPGAVNGVSFDTGNFGTGTKTFTITASATSGTVVPYYCRVHTSSMTEGTITIQ
jgi:plastocyanin